MTTALIERANEVLTYNFDFSQQEEIIAGLSLTGTPTITVNAITLPAGGPGLPIGAPAIATPSGATGTAVVSGGQVTGVTVTAGGSGFLPNGMTQVLFSGGGGAGAAGNVTVSRGAVVGVSITQGGVGYTSAPAVSFSCAAVQLAISPVSANSGYQYSLTCRCGYSDGISFGEAIGNLLIA
jgi:hypothetical protein